jgi:hypothetical protein
MMIQPTLAPMTMNKTTGNRTADLQRALPILATWAAARLVVPLGIAAVVFLVVWLLGESFLSVGVVVAVCMVEPHSRLLSHSARARGIAVIGAPGVGKSRLLGRVLAWGDFLSGIPQLICDLIRLTIDSFLSKLVTELHFLPESEQHQYRERIRYFDMSGSDGYVLQLPLYFRLGTERSLREIAVRLPHLYRKSEPELATRPIMGAAPLTKIGTYTGILLSALGFQITEAESLLRHPTAWFDRFSLAEKRYPSAAEAVRFFRDEDCKLRPVERKRLTVALLDRIFPISLDKRLRATLGTSQPSLRFEDIAAKRQTILLDFRRVRDPDLRRFLLLWVFTYFYEWVKTRGRSPQPFGLILDELVAMTQKVVAGENFFGQELAEFITQYQRSAQIWLSVAFQSPLQLDEEVRETVLSLGTLILGQAPTTAAARVLAEYLCFPNPQRIKHERVFQRGPYSCGGVTTTSKPQKEPVFMPINEQLELYVQWIQRRRMYSFLLRPALSEGEISTEVHPIHIRDIDRDRETGEYRFPHEGLMEQFRATLAAKHGTPVQVLLAEQENRLQPPAARPTPPQSAGGTHHSGTTSEKPAPAPAASDMAEELQPPAPVASGRQRQRRHRLS